MHTLLERAQAFFRWSMDKDFFPGTNGEEDFFPPKEFGKLNLKFLLIVKKIHSNRVVRDIVGRENGDERG